MLKSTLQSRIDVGKINLKIKYVSGFPNIVKHLKYLTCLTDIISLHHPLYKILIYNVHQNVRNLITKMAHFYNSIYYKDYDIIVVTESWLQD